MDKVTSSEFRRRYATLTKPTEVTVLGRTIGVWAPASWPREAGFPYIEPQRYEKNGQRSPKRKDDLGRPDWTHERNPEAPPSVRREGTFNSRPFTPAPKK